MRFRCHEVDGESPRAEIYVKANGETSITGLQAYNPDIDPLTATAVALSAPECIQMTSLTGYPDVFKLTLDEDECDDGASTNRLIRVLGTDNYYTVECTGTSFPNQVSSDVDAIIPVHVHTHYPNPFHVQMAVYEASGWNVPAYKVEFDQDIQLRLTYDTDQMTNGPDNFGKEFYVAFTTHTGVTDLSIEIVTPDLGTYVHITGYHPDELIDEHRPVKRDRACVFPIHVAYSQSTTTTNDWKKESSSIKVESLFGRIGVRVLSKSGKGSSFIALPADVVNTKYRVPELDPPADTSGEVVIIATQDGTNVDIIYNDYTRPAGLQVNGNTVNVGDTFTTVNLNANELLRMKCDGDTANNIVIDASKPVAVIYGLDNAAHIFDPDNAGHSMTQLTPVVNYDNEFVLVYPSPFIGTFAIQQENVGNMYVAYNDMWYDMFYYYLFEPTFLTYDIYETAFETLPKVAIYYHTEAQGSGADPALLPIPSITQFGPINYFYARTGSSYKLMFVGSHLDEITFKTGSAVTSLVGSMLMEQPGYSSTPVRPIYREPQKYYKYELVMTVTSTQYAEDQGLIEFKADNPTRPFMLYILEENDNYRMSYLAYGVRYPTTNPCIPTSSQRPGDAVDNDCDGFVDEEIQNGVDDDGDGEIDEDVTLHEVNMATGIYVDEVNICPYGFDNECYTVVDNGCSTTTYENSAFGISPFVHNTNLADEFDHLYVIDTEVFNAWTYVHSDTLMIEVTYGVCYGSVARCENSCITKRSDDEDKWGVQFKLPVIRNGTKLTTARQDSVSTVARTHPCSNNPVFWIPMAILLLILLVECAATTYFVHKWIHNRQNH